MSLDVNPKKGYLIACGMYDGSVSIFNVRENKHTYLFNSYPTKHSEPVWSIKWMENDVEDRLRFCSIAPDGRVSQFVNHSTCHESTDRQVWGPTGPNRSVIFKILLVRCWTNRFWSVDPCHLLALTLIMFLGLDVDIV